MKIACLLIFLTLLVACGGDYLVPKDYLEACYGGSYKKNVQGTKAEFTASIELEPQDWKKIYEIALATAAKYDLERFGDAQPSPHLASIDLCSSDGLILNFSQHYFDGHDGTKRSPVFIKLYPYKASYRWEPIAKDLSRTFSHLWFGKYKEGTVTAVLTTGVI